MERQFLYHQKPQEIKEVRGSKGVTRHTYAGKFNSENNTLVIGISGNHPNDSFCKSKGRQIAVGRTLVTRESLTDTGKQVIINNVTEENARDVFFSTVKELM